MKDPFPCQGLICRIKNSRKDSKDMTYQTVESNDREIQALTDEINDIEKDSTRQSSES